MCAHTHACEFLTRAEKGVSRLQAAVLTDQDGPQRRCAVATFKGPLIRQRFTLVPNLG